MIPYAFNAKNADGIRGRICPVCQEFIPTTPLSNDNDNKCNAYALHYEEMHTFNEKN